MSSSVRADPTRLSWWLGLGAALLHMPFLTRYGYHGDELYFLSCAARPDLGYVDHAPLIPLMAAVVRSLGGDALLPLRLLAGLAGGCTVALTARLCGELGGGRFAMVLAALGIALAPFFLRTANLFAIPSFEPVWWTLSALLLVRIVQQDRPRLWLWFGAVAGLGLLTKHTMLLWGFALAVAIALTSVRRQLATPWPWLGAGVALLLFLPNLLWQAAHGWPTIDFAVHLNQATMARIGRADFLLGQLLYAGPGAAVLWLPGAVYLLRRTGPGRLLGIAFVTVLAVLLLLQSKIYYSMPAYPTAFAGGALLWERLLHAWRWRTTLAAVVVAPGLLLSPISVPVLPIEQLDRYAAAATFGLAGKAHEITGDLHGMYGWPEVAAGMTAALAALPADERQRAMLLVNSYSVAGAIEHFAPSTAPILCNHMSWHFWSRDLLARRQDLDPVVLAYGIPGSDLARWFADVQQVAVIAGDARANRWQREQAVHRCRQPRPPLAAQWPLRPSL